MTKQGLASRPAREFCHYNAYGVSIRSDIVLPLLPAPERSPAFFEIQVRGQIGTIPPSIRQKVELELNPFSALDIGSLPEGSNYVGLRDVGEFLISKDGRSIRCYRFPQAKPESFHVYLLGQALSFALVKNGIEPLHATVLEVGGKAIAFLGDSGFGKSTLAAEFLRAGYRLLTDDLLVLGKGGDQFVAYPGPPRIKLFSEIARKWLGDSATGVPMWPQMGKLIIPLNQEQTCRAPIPLVLFYALASPDEMALETDIRITALSPRETFVRILAGAFNNSILDRQRLQHHFETTEVLAHCFTVKELSYPRKLGCLPRVREAILSDLFASHQPTPCAA